MRKRERKKYGETKWIGVRFAFWLKGIRQQLFNTSIFTHIHMFNGLSSSWNRIINDFSMQLLTEHCILIDCKLTVWTAKQTTQISESHLNLSALHRCIHKTHYKREKQKNTNKTVQSLWECALRIKHWRRKHNVIYRMNFTTFEYVSVSGLTFRNDTSQKCLFFASLLLKMNCHINETNSMNSFCFVLCCFLFSRVYCKCLTVL